MELCRSLYHLCKSFSDLKKGLQNLTFQTLQDFRIVEVGRDLRSFSIQPPLSSVQGQSRATSPHPVANEGVSITSLEQCSTTTMVKKKKKRSNPPIFYLLLDGISCVPVLAHYLPSFNWKESGFMFEDRKKSLWSKNIIQLHICLLWQNTKAQYFIHVSYYFPESLSKTCSCTERCFSDRHA